MTPSEGCASGWSSPFHSLGAAFGLFSILPVFAIYGRELPGGRAYLIGLAISIYGLTQAMFQIPGAASDRFGRKLIIVAGLLVFAVGSVIAALSDNVAGVIAGRAVQGAGAISAAVSAFIADSTRDEVRTKASAAMVGGSIGLISRFSLIAAPPLTAWIGLSGLFWLTAVLACLGIAVVIWAVPPAPVREEQPEPLRHGDVLFNPQLLRLNMAYLSCTSVRPRCSSSCPHCWSNAGCCPHRSHWQVYLPVIVVSFVVMVPPMIMAEKRGRLREVFLGAIALLVIAMLAAPALTHTALAGLVTF